MKFKSVRSTIALAIALLPVFYFLGNTQIAAQSWDREVPVLCYHQVRDWTNNDSKNARSFIIPPYRFKQHMQMLRDSGYHAISPDQLTDYLLLGKPLPDNPVVLSFDDGTISQYANALPELDDIGYKAVFFIMTVTLDRPGYLSRKQVQELCSRGHTIGCHTWDHHDVRAYSEQDWELQLAKPTRVLQQITGRPIRYFAYPYGLWNSKALTQLKKQGYVAAFQLSSRQDSAKTTYTIRRIIADGQWAPAQLHNAIKRSFR